MVDVLTNHSITKTSTMSGTSITHFNNLDQPAQAKIWLAIDKLCKNNPHVVEQLEKLADLKENDAFKWKLGCRALKLPA